MQYKLKEGVELHPYGEDSLINNDNLTDAIAEYLIESGRATAEDFEPAEDEPVKKKGK